MRVGLVDVDGHNKKTRWGSAFPNLALMKICAYHRAMGDEVMWASPIEHYDILYMSKVFTFSPDVTDCYNADKILRGGTGYDISAKLPPPIDRLQPDYSLYPWIDSRTAYGFLTRGCPNKCKWCIVPLKEGAVVAYMDIDEIAIDGRDHIVLMDNNILASDYGLQQIEKIVDRCLHVDFNQAMDARLVTEDIAQLLAKVKWWPYPRFGCDTHAQIKHCDRAISWLRKYGYNGPVFLYTMIDDFEESVERVSYYRDRLVAGEKLYPHVQPYLDFNNPNYVPYKWQQDMARWSGIVSLKKTFPVMDYEPRKGFVFSMYRDIPELRQCRTKEEIAAILNKRGRTMATVPILSTDPGTFAAGVQEPLLF